VSDNVSETRRGERAKVVRQEGPNRVQLRTEDGRTQSVVTDTTKVRSGDEGYVRHFNSGRAFTFG
jgi:hypothetical protein